MRYATVDELASALSGAEVLLVWDFTSDAVRAAWPAADGLRWVHTASAGVDRVAFPELLSSDVVITNSRGVFDLPIAEYVLGLVLAFAKDLPGTLRLQQNRTWRHRETERVAGRRAVVVGSGPIGRAVSQLLHAVGLRVDLVGRVERTGDPEFGTVRGQDAPGRLAGAALDVFETEPLPATSGLWDAPGLVVSPHMSGDVHGWRTELVTLFIENLDRYARGQPLHNVVDKARGYVTHTGGTPTARTGRTP